MSGLAVAIGAVVVGGTATLAQSSFAFDFGCATPSAYPSGQIVFDADFDSSAQGIKKWADRAVTADLDGDGIVEYFVPVVCGATGNCSWAVCAVNPPRMLGHFTAAVASLGGSRKPWPEITTYEALGAGRGVQAMHRFESGKYHEVIREVVEGEANASVLHSMGRPSCHP